MNAERLLGLLALALAGGLLFASRFGLHILHPYQYSWLLPLKTDRSYDFLHWLYYKESPPSFPVGVIEHFGFPQEVPLIYTTAIPLLAIPPKALDPILEATVWQPYGWWLLLCWILQGAIGYQLLRSMGIRQFWIRVVGTSFFWLSPFLLTRIDHMALCAHWLPLGGLWLYFESSWGFQKKMMRWFLLSALSLLSHPYFVLYALATGLALLWQGRTSWPTKGGWLLGYAAFLTGLLYLFGYFLFPTDSYVERGYGTFSANLNTFFNNMGRTNAPLDFPIFTQGQYKEGFGYLGVGGLALVLLAALWAAWHPRAFRDRLRMHWPIAVAVLLLFVFSLSNAISFNDWGVTIPLPDFALRLATVFRSTGRFVWMPAYLLLAAGWWSLDRFRFRPLITWALLAALLGLQLWDIRPKLKPVYKPVALKARMPFPEAPLKAAFAGAGRIITYPPYSRTVQEKDDITDLIFWAAQNHKPITTGHLPRFHRPLRRATVDSIEAAVQQGRFEWFPRTLWIYSQRTAPLFGQHEGLQTFRSGPYYVAFPPAVPVPTSFFTAPALEKDRTRFVHLADFLREADYAYLVIAAQDEARNGLDKRARAYFRSFGSAANALEFRGSWAAVFAGDTLIAEQIRRKNEGPAELEVELLPAEGSGPARKLQVRSAGMEAGNFSYIGWKGEENLSIKRRGLNMVLLDKTLEPVEVLNLDTYLTSFLARAED